MVASADPPDTPSALVEATIAARASELAEVMGARGGRIVLAESCTGGWLAKAMTDRPGSSAWFDRGFVTYSNAAKQELLGVDPACFTDHGAVSEAIVRAMARGALQRSTATLTLAVSGIAGPGGGSPDKPVGTVWFAWGDATRLQARAVHFAGDRDAVRGQAVVFALEQLRDVAA